MGWSGKGRDSGGGSRPGDSARGLWVSGLAVCPVQTQRNQVHIKTPTRADLWKKGIYYCLKGTSWPPRARRTGVGAEQQNEWIQGLPPVSLSTSVPFPAHLAILLSFSLCLCSSLCVSLSLLSLPLSQSVSLWVCLSVSVSLSFCHTLLACLHPAGRALGPLRRPTWFFSLHTALPLSCADGQTGSPKPQLAATFG